MRFSEKDTHSILLYINTIKNTEFLFDTKISIHLGECDLTDETAVDFFPPCSNQNLCELYLQGNNYSIEFQLLLANQFSTLEYLSFPPPKYRPPIHISFTEKIKEERTNVYTADYDILVLGLCQATQLKGLQIMESLDYCYFQFLKDVLPQFSNLQEISICNSAMLPAISELSNLTYLSVMIDRRTQDRSLHINLSQLIFYNRTTIRCLKTHNLDKIGLRGWGVYF